MNETDKVDLSALDPTRDSTRFDRIAAAIGRDAMAARSRRAGERPDIYSGVAAWSRPALLAAGLVLAVAIPALVRHRGPDAPPVSMTEIMGIPRELTDLLRSSRTPSLVELHAALATTAGR